MKSVQDQISRTLTALQPGQIVTPPDFRGHGSQDAIKMALSRLVKNGELNRIAHGIYYRKYQDPDMGELIPSAEMVAEMLAEKEKVRIRPAGAFALNKLGLSTQVPTKLVYLTDGSPRKFMVGKVSVEFKPASPKKMALSGEITGPLILALDDLDLKQLTPAQEKRILALLKLGDPLLSHDLKLAPGKIYDFLIKMISQHNDIIPFSSG